MNQQQSLLYKEAGGKESARREKYLNQLLNVSGRGSLTLAKHANAQHQLFNAAVPPEALGPGFNNSAAKLQSAELNELRSRSHFRTSSQPDGLSGVNYQGDPNSDAYQKRVFAVPRIDLTQSFRGNSVPWSYKSSELPQAVYVSMKDSNAPQNQNYLIQDQGEEEGLRSKHAVRREKYSLVSSNTVKRANIANQKMMTLKKKKIQQS